VVDFVLNGLSNVAFKPRLLALHTGVVVCHENTAISLGIANTWQREAAFTRIVGALALNITSTEPSLSSTAMMRLRTPIMFAAMPTQVPICARSVSSKSRATSRSASPAGSLTCLSRNRCETMGRIMKSTSILLCGNQKAPSHNQPNSTASKESQNNCNPIVSSSRFPS